MATPPNFRRLQAALACVAVVAARPAFAQAPQSAPQPDVPLGRTVAPGVEQTPYAWHDTYFYWDNAVTASTVGIGQNYQTRDPVYELTFGLRPRYYFVDTSQATISARADLGIVSERTNSDTTTEEGEWSATDFELYGAFSYKLRESADDLTELALRLPRLTLPTSRVSWDSGKLLGLGLRAGVREDVALEGRGATFLPNIELIVKAEYNYLFTRSEVPTNPGLERIRLDADGRSIVSDQLGGASFARHSAVFGAASLLHVHRDVLWTTALEIRPAWKYPVDHDVEICGVVLTGCTEPTGVDDPQTRSVLTFFQTDFWITISNSFGLSIGYANLTAQLGPDGTRRSVFYSPDARFYATLNVGLDHLYGSLAHRSEQASREGQTRTP
ncbi:MAG TPA: hypothetical protein VHV51_13825 [Polyangiaceae bacterium]|nr:hypothetical protein [Polyangiaceae bacterium]